MSYPAAGGLETPGLAYPADAAAGYYRIFVSAADEVGRAQQARLGRLLLLTNAGALLLTLAAAWGFARSALRPFTRLSRQVRQISATSLARRLPEGNGRARLARLAQDFNVMLAGLAQAFEAQQSFLSHASHELRTPLTGLVGTLETGLEYDTTPTRARCACASRSRGRPGYGLGLPLTQRVLQRHGGRRALSSAPGQGTTAEVGRPALPG